jgi:hypothetical protein
MRTLLGAVAGALAMGAVLVSYNLGERRSFSRDMMAPATQMVIGPDGVARPYLVQASDTSYGQAPYGAAYGWSPYAPYAPAAPVAVAPYGSYPAPMPQYAAQRVVTEQPVVRRAATQRAVRAEPAAPRRSWQKSALLIGGSAGAGAGLGALMGGKKGALAGAAIGGGAATIFDQVKRH